MVTARVHWIVTENVETAGRKVLQSELTNTIELFIAYVHRNEARTFHLHLLRPICYIIRMYLRLPLFTKTLPQMSFHLFFPTHNSADCWNAHRSPASRDSFKRVPAKTVYNTPHVECILQIIRRRRRLMQGWVASAGCPPPTKILVTPVPLMQAGCPQPKS